METCNVCGMECKSLHGLKIHIRKAHSKEKVAMSRLGEIVLEAMAPHLDSVTSVRLATFLSKLDVWPHDGHVVVTPDGGPWLAASLGVGAVVRSTRGACVVYPLSVAMDAQERERWRAESEEHRSRRGRPRREATA
jgi:hypothetical protein